MDFIRGYLNDGYQHNMWFLRDSVVLPQQMKQQKLNEIIEFRDDLDPRRNDYELLLSSLPMMTNLRKITIGQDHPIPNNAANININNDLLPLLCTFTKLIQLKIYPFRTNNGYNLINIVPDEIMNLKKLTELQLPLGPNPQISENITRLRYLKEVDITGTLSTLPQNILRVSNLKGLGLWYCSNITSLPESIG